MDVVVVTPGRGSAPAAPSPARYRVSASALLRWSVLDWSVIALAWWAMARADAWPVDLVAVLVVAGRLHALGGLLHDACHRARREGGPRWWVLEALAGWPIASTTAAMRYHHLRHHRHANTALDPYRRPTLRGRPLPFAALCLRGLLLPAWWTLRAPFGACALLVPRLRGTYARAFLQDRSNRRLDDDPEVLACARAEIAQLLGQATVAGAAIVAGWPVVLPYLVPLHVAGVLNATRLALEHDGALHAVATRANVLSSTRSGSLGWMGDWLLYPHNLGLHVEHHLHPGVGFMHLPRFRALADEAAIRS